MKYKSFKLLLGEDKKISDPICCRVIFRPLSFPIGWVVYKLGMSANLISLLSIFISLMSFFVLIFFSSKYVIIISILLLIVALLDCVDGNVARARGSTGPGGEWLDAMSGYVVYAIIPVALGLHIDNYYHTYFFSGFWVLIGAISSISNLFLRLIYQKFINSWPDNSVKIKFKGNNSLYSRLSSEAGLVGWMMPALLVAAITNMLQIYLALYCIFYMISAAMLSIVLVRKVI